jgi:DNA helicase-2/ATP-dependent DNA helicase PcrA
LEQAALYSETDRLDSDADRVNLMTLHAAKGLEFPYVFIIAVEQDILPHRRCREDPLQMEEERRLLFVGMTRAKEELQLSCAKSRSFRGNQNVSAASMFLMELPRAEMQISDLTEQWDAYADSWDRGDDAFDDFFDRHFGSDEEATAPAPAKAQKKMSVDADPGFDQHFDQGAPEIDAWEADSGVKVTARRPTGKDRVAELLASKQIRTANEVGDESDAAPTVPPEAFCPNAVVSHPTYGSGKITSASGRGLRRTVTVEFFSDGLSRSFVLKFAKLTLESID